MTNALIWIKFPRGPPSRCRRGASDRQKSDTQQRRRASGTATPPPRRGCRGDHRWRKVRFIPVPSGLLGVTWSSALPAGKDKPARTASSAVDRNGAKREFGALEFTLGEAMGKKASPRLKLVAAHGSRRLIGSETFPMSAPASCYRHHSRNGRCLIGGAAVAYTGSFMDPRSGHIAAFESTRPRMTRRRSLPPNAMLGGSRSSLVPGPQGAAVRGGASRAARDGPSPNLRLVLDLDGVPERQGQDLLARSSMMSISSLSIRRPS